MADKYILYADDPRRRKVIGGSLLGNIFTLVWPTLLIFGLATALLFYVKTHLPLILSKMALFNLI